MTMQTPVQSGMRSGDPPSGPSGSSVVDAAKEEATAMAERAKSETGRLVEQARHTLRAQSHEQAGRVAAGAHDLAGQLHALASGQGGTDGTVAHFAHEAADRVDALAERFDREGLDGVTREVKQFARRRPGTYLLGAFAVGIAAGRLFRNADSSALAEAARPDGNEPASAMSRSAMSPTMSPTSSIPSTPIQEEPLWPSQPQP